jgi:tRNA(fMet)-specific endonuclease VapC
MVGVELSEGDRRLRREAFVEAVMGAVSIEPYDVGVAEAHAALLADARRRGRPRGPHDLIIAATARTRRRAVVSADRAAFEDLPDVLVH